MSLLNQFLAKPVQATVISLVVALLGIQAMMQLDIRQYPEQSLPSRFRDNEERTFVLPLFECSLTHDWISCFTPGSNTAIH